MPDIQRNEVGIELAGETRVMRATFGAIRGIERDLGKSLVRIVEDLGQRGDLGVTDAALIIHHGLRGYGDTRLTLEQVGEALVAEGFAAKTVAVAEFIRMALMGAGLGKPEAAAS